MELLMDNDLFEEAIQDLLEQRALVLESAVQAMCKHYNCLPSCLTLNKTDNRNTNLLVKDDPGLAYTIELIFEEESARVVGTPIYLDRKGKLNDGR